MIKAEVPWLQRNYLTRLDYDARYAVELSNLIGLVGNPIKLGMYSAAYAYLAT